MVFRSQDLETGVLCASGEEASCKSLTTGCILHTLVSHNPPAWHLPHFLPATLPFNLNLSPAASAQPGPLPHPSCSSLCTVHVTLVSCVLFPQNQSLGAYLLPTRGVHTRKACCRTRWLSLGFRPALISAITDPSLF